MKKIRKIGLLLAMLILTMSLPLTAEAAVKISKKSVTLTKTQSTTLKINGTKKKVAWSSSKKSVATVSSKGIVTAKKKGTVYGFRGQKIASSPNFFIFSQKRSSASVS